MALDTLALDPPNWDLTLDANGNLATFGDGTPGTQTGPGMRMAQDVASRVRAWRGEVWFDVDQGIDYPRYMGLTPAIVQLQADYQAEALLTPECSTALADFSLDRTTRQVGGALYLTDISGYSAQVAV